MKKFVHLSCALALLLVMALPSFAHFQVILPDQSIVSQKDPKTIGLFLEFTHPFEQMDMNMERPVRFGVLSRGKHQDLLEDLKSVDLEGGLKSWKCDYTVKRPGDLVFYVEPQPYWEPAEDKYIIHDTKVIVNAMGMESGWDEAAGLRAEIMPLTRPYGLWAGNVFQGRVVVDGKPVSGAEVEVEYYNADSAVKVPADPFITQVVLSDENGIFTYAAPFAGWWGFAALTDAPETMKSPDGRDVSVELGAVMWVRFEGRD